ncbi:MAG: 50S ribosomal protein L29 [Candidatus Hydrogenedentes bacterium]|nr:50S ribosomal protein L29 [Candidatus Hydrogenedentota bacterium]
MRANDLREKTDEELDQILVERTEDIMHFRLQTATGIVDNVRKSREARKDIARIKTILKDRRSGGSAVPVGGGD